MRNFGMEKYARLGQSFIYDSGNICLFPSQMNKKSKRFNIQLRNEIHQSA